MQDARPAAASGLTEDELNKNLIFGDHQEMTLNRVLDKMTQIEAKLDLLEEKIDNIQDVSKAATSDTHSPKFKLLFGKKASNKSKGASSWSSIKKAAEHSYLNSHHVTRLTRRSPWAIRLSLRDWAVNFRREMADRPQVVDPIIYSVSPPLAQKPVRPRVMHAIPNVHIGGSTQLVVDIFNGLNNDFDMQVMTSSFPPVGRHEGFVIHDFGGNARIEDFIRVLKEFDPSILHVHYWGSTDDYWYEKVFQAAGSLRIPVIQNINTPVMPFAYHGVSKIVYVSRYVQENFPSTIGRENERVIYPGMDLKAFVSSKPISADALDSIGMVYRLETDKLNAESIEPFIEVVLKRKKTRVYIIGGGSLLRHFKERVNEAGVKNNFQFTGYVPYSDLPSLYEKFSIFVAPVWKESFGQVAPFAMHMGRAVAGYDIGALSEILGDRSMLASDSEALSNVIVNLLEQPDELKRIGQTNRDIAARMFGIDTMINSYKDLYNEMTGQSCENPLRFFPENKIYPSR
ncbi:UNVERIFIED_ORG: glycosyltransferase involved in cell wall biosynthesis [Methylorubrum zatmanii]